MKIESITINMPENITENDENDVSLEETVRLLKRGLKLVQDGIQRIMEKTLEGNLAYIKGVFQKYVEQIVDACSPSEALEKMGEVQFIQWAPMSDEFEEEIIKSENVNKTLREHMEREKYKTVQQTIAECREFSVMQPHLRLFNQSVDAFTHGNCDLAVAGFVPVFDGLLSDISSNTTHSLSPRVDAIKKILDRQVLGGNNNFVMLSFAWTFTKTIESFAAFSKFSEKEPKGLNRHWIAHGRSRRKKTKLDCVKMINLIYGLLLIEIMDQAD